MKTDKLSWTISETLQALKDHQLNAWFYKEDSSTNNGELRNAKDSGIIDLILEGFVLRPISLIESKPKIYTVIDQEEILHYLYTICSNDNILTSLSDENKMKILNYKLSFIIYSDVNPENKRIIEHSQYL